MMFTLVQGQEVQEGQEIPWCTLHCAVCTMHCTVHTALCSVHRALHCAHCTVHCIVHTALCTALCTLHCALHCAHCTVHCIVHTAQGVRGKGVCVWQMCTSQDKDKEDKKLSSLDCDEQKYSK